MIKSPLTEALSKLNNINKQSKRPSLTEEFSQFKNWDEIDSQLVDLLDEQNFGFSIKPNDRSKSLIDKNEAHFEAIATANIRRMSLRLVVKGDLKYDPQADTISIFYEYADAINTFSGDGEAGWEGPGTPRPDSVIKVCKTTNEIALELIRLLKEFKKYVEKMMED